MIASRALFALALTAVPVHGDGDLRALDADLRALRADRFDALFQKHGAANDVDWRLLRAVAQVESHLNPRAVNRRDPSFGLMQVHCVADAAGRCTNRFDVEGWAGMTRGQLMEPETNVRIGAQVLAWNVRTFGLERGIACYNAWSVCRDRQREPFSNAYYVYRVLLEYRRLVAARTPKRLEGQISRSVGRELLHAQPPHGDHVAWPPLRAPGLNR